jgi:hypothetical protein
MTRDWKQWLRLILAVLFAPILAAGLVAALLAIIMVPEMVFETQIDSATSQPASIPQIMASLVGFGVFGGALGVFLGWPAMILGGLPVHAWLVRKGRTDWLPYALIGLGVGTITMLIYLLATGSWRDPMGLLDGGPLLLSGPLTGFLAASLFWLIRLPPRSSAP